MTMLRAAISLVLCTSLAIPSVASANTYVVEEAETAEAAEDEAPPPPDTLSDEEKLEWAKKLYMKAKAFHDAEDYYNSVIKYEEAYRYAPDKHIFAYNLGIDAWELRDCARVKQYLQLFMIKDDSHPDLRKTAKEILDQADGNEECVTAGGNGVVTDQGGGGTAEPVTDDDGPELTAKGRPEDGIGDSGPKKKPSGLLIGGSVMTVLGVGALGAGIATTIVAKGKHTTLMDATAPSPTSFADDYYSDLRADDKALKTLNVVNPVLLIAGGVLLAGGITMIVIDRGQKKKGKGHYAKQGKAKLTGLGIGPTAGGAAASMTLQF